MRIRLMAVSGAAVALLTWSAAGQAAAFETIIGGLAGECSTLARAGHHDSDALTVCTRALAGEPLNTHDRAGTYINRGAMELGANDLEAAHADFDAAIKIRNDMGEAHIGQGAYLITMERYADAEGEISRGLSLGSEEPEKGYYFRGIARWGQEDFKGAYLDFRKASELKPGWDLPRNQLTHFKVEPAG